MSGYKSFAIWGAGNQGRALVKALLTEPSVSSVTVLTRLESKDKDSNKELAAQGVTVTAFDASAENAADKLKGIDVLISTTGAFGLAIQPKLIHAAHKAGVKLFVPAEWSMDGDDRDLKSTFDDLKNAVREEARRVGLPTASFFPGLWIDFLPLRFGWDLANNKITIRGTGEQPVSMTSIDDVGRFTAHALTAFSRDELENAKFFIEAERISFGELAQQLQQESGKTIEVVRTGREELEEAAAKPNDFAAKLAFAWESGKGIHRAQLANSMWPEWKPQSAVQVLRSIM